MSTGGKLAPANSKIRIREDGRMDGGSRNELEDCERGLPMAQPRTSENGNVEKKCTYATGSGGEKEEGSCE